MTILTENWHTDKRSFVCLKHVVFDLCNTSTANSSYGLYNILKTHMHRLILTNSQYCCTLYENTNMHILHVKTYTCTTII